MNDVLEVKEQSKIPELNEYQCGTYSMHSLEEAHEIAHTILKEGIGVMDNEALKLDVTKM